jgi:hypothetical protein
MTAAEFINQARRDADWIAEHLKLAEQGVSDGIPNPLDEISDVRQYISALADCLNEAEILLSGQV